MVAEYAALAQSKGKNRMKLLFYGTKNAPYHPMGEFAERMQKLFPDAAFEVTDREADFRKLSDGDVTVCVLYPDFEQEQLSGEATAELLSYTAVGGRLLVLHNGISVQTRPELAQMVGGAFLDHPPYEKLPIVPYKILDQEHPVTAGVGDFFIPDEFYRFELANLTELRMLLGYEYEGDIYPAGWLRDYGLGAVVYLCCGHGAYAFDSKAFCRLVKNAVCYLAENEIR